MKCKKAAILLFNLCMTLLTVNAFSQKNTVNSYKTEQSFDFGNIKKGEVVHHIFTIENTSDSAFVILNAVTQCGCTVPELPKEIIEPGETAEINIKFNADGKFGYQRKTIRINLSNKEEVKLIIYAQIID